MKRLQARALKDLVTNPDLPSSPRAIDSKSRGRGDNSLGVGGPEAKSSPRPTTQQNSNKAPELNAEARKFFISSGFKAYVEGVADLGCVTMEDVQTLCNTPDCLKRLQGRDLGLSIHEAKQFIKAVQNPTRQMSAMSPEAMTSKLKARLKEGTRSRSRSKAFEPSSNIGLAPDKYVEVDSEVRKFLISNGFKAYVQGLEELSCVKMESLVDFCEKSDALKKLQGSELRLTPFDAKHFIKLVKGSNKQFSPTSPEAMASKLQARLKEGTRSRSRNKAIKSVAEPSSNLSPGKYDEVDSEVRKFLSVHRLQHYSTGLADLKCLNVDDLVAFCESSEANKALQGPELKLTKFEAKQFTRLVNKNNPRARAGRWAAIEKLESNIRQGNRSKSRTRKAFDTTPTRGLIPDKAPEVSPEVRKFLSANRLQVYCNGLAELGCVAMDELIELCDTAEGLTALQGPELGVSLFHARSLVKLVTVGANSPKHLKVVLEVRKAEHEENGRVVLDSAAKRAALAVAQAELLERGIVERVRKVKREAEAKVKFAALEAEHARNEAERLAARALGYPSAAERVEAELAADAAEYEAKDKVVAEARAARVQQLQRHHADLAAKKKKPPTSPILRAGPATPGRAAAETTHSPGFYAGPTYDWGAEFMADAPPPPQVDLGIKELILAFRGVPPSQTLTTGGSSPAMSVVETMGSKVEAWEVALTARRAADKNAEFVASVEARTEARNRRLEDIRGRTSGVPPDRGSVAVLTSHPSPVWVSAPPTRAGREPAQPLFDVSIERHETDKLKATDEIKARAFESLSPAAREAVKFALEKNRNEQEAQAVSEGIKTALAAACRQSREEFLSVAARAEADKEATRSGLSLRT
jgi:uncharacterized protein YifE (UPF0438 family)